MSMKAHVPIDAPDVREGARNSQPYAVIEERIAKRHLESSSELPLLPPPPPQTPPPPPPHESLSAYPVHAQRDLGVGLAGTRIAAPEVGPLRLVAIEPIGTLECMVAKHTPVGRAVVMEKVAIPQYPEYPAGLDFKSRRIMFAVSVHELAPVLGISATDLTRAEWGEGVQFQSLLRAVAMLDAYVDNRP